MKKILLLVVFLFSSAFSAYALEEVYYGLKKIIHEEGGHAELIKEPFSPDDKHLVCNWQINGRAYVYIYDLETFDIVGIYDDMKELFFRDSLLFLSHSVAYIGYIVPDTSYDKYGNKRVTIDTVYRAIGDTSYSKYPFVDIVYKKIAPTVVLHYPDYEVVKELPYVPDDVTSLINGKRYVLRGNSIFDYETGKITISKLNLPVWLNVYSDILYGESTWTTPDSTRYVVQYLRNISDSNIKSKDFGYTETPSESFNSVNRAWTGKERLKVPKPQYKPNDSNIYNPFGGKPIWYIDFKNGEDFTDDRNFIPMTNQLDENMNYKYWREADLNKKIVYTYWNQVWIPVRKHSTTPGALYSRDFSVAVLVAYYAPDPPDNRVLKMFIWHIDSVVSVGDSIQGNKSLVVYSNGELRITPPSNNYSIIISDLAGSVMLERQFTNALDALVVNVSRWSRGMYLVNITDSKGNFYPYKFVQEK